MNKYDDDDDDDYDQRVCLNICMSVCLSVRSHISKNQMSKVYETFCTCCGRGSVLLRQQCSMLRTSGFVDDVIFYIMRPVGQNQRQRYVLSSSPGGGTGVKFADYDCLVLRCSYNESDGI